MGTIETGRRGRSRRSIAGLAIAGLAVAAGLVLADDLATLIERYRRAKRDAATMKKKAQDPRAAERLVPLLREIAQLGSDASLRFLIEEYATNDPAVAPACATILLEVPRDEAAAAVVAGYPRRPAPVRRAIAEAIAKAPGPRAPGLIEKEIDRATSPERLLAFLPLAGELKLEGARRKVIACLAHPRADVAREAMRALAAMGVGSDPAPLIEAFARAAGWDATLRIAVLDALAASGSEAGIACVLRAAKASDPDMRATATGSLGRAGDRDDVFDALLGALRDPAFPVRSAAFFALRRVRRKEMIPALIAFLDGEKNERLRIDALTFLVSLTGQNMGFVTQDWRNWWETAKERFAFAKPGGSGTRVVPRDLRYFGIEVTSKRIAFVVDASNSMLGPVRGPKKGAGKGAGKAAPRARPGERKIDALKRELSRVIAALPEDGMINIIPFNARFNPWRKRLAPLRGTGRKEAIAFVEGLGCAFGTNIYDTLEFVLQDPDVDTIYLLSDGKPVGGRFTEPEDILREIGERNRTRGAVIHTISFGKVQEWMERLAAQNGGAHRSGDED